jgi:dTDP-glucose pyrophosphorylase
MNIVIPMAGSGQRFKDAGYTTIKPLIEVNGIPMIQRVIENLNLPDAYVYLLHRLDDIDLIENLGIPIRIKRQTAGAASTILCIKEIINTNEPLIISNCDELLEWNSSNANDYEGDGCIFTTKASGPKWSYVKTENGFVTQVAEKVEISDEATVGVYCWKRGKDFVKYAEQMITNDEKVNGEFYVAPVYNGAIKDGLKIITKSVDKFWSLGTPEDLDHAIKHCPLI